MSINFAALLSQSYNLRRESSYQLLSKPFKSIRQNFNIGFHLSSVKNKSKEGSNNKQNSSKGNTDKDNQASIKHYTKPKPKMRK